MAVSITDFKKYARYPVPAQAGTNSRGLVTIRRSDVQTTNIIAVPENTVFSVALAKALRTLKLGN